MIKDVAVAVMAKAPIPGFSKTRMIPALGEAGAAELQQQLTQQLIDRLSPEVRIELWCTPDTTHPFFQSLVRYKNITLHKQPESELGERMYQALEHGLNNHKYAIVVGTDIPSIDLNTIQQTVNALRQDSDVVILPIEDGGYGLLGIKQNHPELFNNIEWGTSRVYQKTVEIVKALNMTWHDLPLSWDLDEPRDLERFTL